MQDAEVEFDIHYPELQAIVMYWKLKLAAFSL